jgi:hypothetical protein
MHLETMIVKAKLGGAFISIIIGKIHFNLGFYCTFKLEIRGGLVAIQDRGWVYFPWP